MDDVTIRLLLSRFIKQSLNDSRAESIDDDGFSESVATAAWNSLIYLLRQSFVQQDRICLQQVGEFVKESGEWKFHPAASLAEADAFQLPAERGRKKTAQRALFHVEQGLQLAQALPTDVENPRQPEPWKYVPLQDAPSADETLATELKRLSVELFGVSRRLTSSVSDDLWSVKADQPAKVGALRTRWDEERQMFVDVKDNEPPRPAGTPSTLQLGRAIGPADSAAAEPVEDRQDYPRAGAIRGPEPIESASADFNVLDLEE